MRLACALLAVVAAAVVAFWAWLGAPVEMPQAVRGASGKFDCVSYAPFRGDDTPFGPDVPVDPHQIDQDLAQLKAITGCVRTYSTDRGVDQVPEIARRYGLKVMQGLWVSNQPELTRKQIETTVALTKRFPDVIQSVVVGNEVLLRGEMSAPALAALIRSVKAQVAVPVTYADVWEYWLRYPEMAAAVDFITIHVLPYWEDFPIPAAEAARHVDLIRKRVVAAFPGKEVLIGEFGWPSAGRMREGALPSPAIQARLLQEVTAQAQRDHYRINVIEAYDQPWKRQLEGTVGGYWGIFDAYTRKAKFVWGAPVSDHPRWVWQAAGGVALAALTFAFAALPMRRKPASPPDTWYRIGAGALVAALLAGWAVADVPIESLTAGDWLRSCAWAAAAIVSPLLMGAAVARDIQVPTFLRMLGRTDRPRHPLALALGALLIVLTLVAVQAALGMVFDPRYRDFPVAPLWAATVPLLMTTRTGTTLRNWEPLPQYVAAAALVLSAGYIVINESVANWQALWFCGGLVVLALTLTRVRDAQG